MIGRICAAIAAFALAGTALAAEPLSGGGDARAEQIRAEPETQPALAPVPAARARRTTLDAIPNVALDAPTVDAFPGKALFSGEAGTPLQVGFGRPLAALATESAMGWQLAWESLPEGGWIGAVSVTSAAASALRLGLRVEALPPGATLRFHGPGNDEVFEVSAAQVEATIERNFASGEPADAARMFWSPVVESDTVVVEIELARGTSPAGVRIAAPMVSHLLTRASANFVMPKAAASCEIDAMCHQDAWGKESNAVARIIFTKNGSSFVCSGTLLADKDPSTFIPYFLTANHCITSQLVASTMQSYWFYRASACDSGVRGNFQTLFGGATLLYGTTSTDTAFMRLNGTPPAGVAYAGWLASSAPVPSAPVTGIHHPDGDLQKITFGNVASFWTCVPSSSGDFTCNNAPSASATFFTVAWRDGITEPGSSGSGVFLDNGHYLIGQLYGGTNACGTPGGRDWFGRFDIAYNSALYQWLGSTAAAPITPALNYSDMWWNPDESGWGLSITQHSPTIFAAWYIYDSSGRPQWIVMPGGHWTTTTSFTGDLYTATGPDPRGAFDPGLVARARGQRHPGVHRERPRHVQLHGRWRAGITADPAPAVRAGRYAAGDELRRHVVERVGIGMGPVHQPAIPHPRRRLVRVWRRWPCALVCRALGHVVRLRRLHRHDLSHHGGAQSLLRHELQRGSGDAHAGRDDDAALHQFRQRDDDLHHRRRHRREEHHPRVLLIISRAGPTFTSRGARESPRSRP
ncbi:MAG: trypsin-like serine peptidase [Usitatibacter sp.]